ncbi:hypothetical protein KL944_002339 [Ogataea haglerorum]|nr:hypothetical protein KL944_002339 [Ogataea haglerorum]
MKFGDEFNDRSVSKWRNYNIDYNDIKRKIKEATTAIKDSSSSLSDKSNDTNDTSDTAFSRFSTNSQQDKRTRKHLKQLFRAFKEQIEFTSLFVNSKYGEISRRILATKSLLNNFINSTLGSESNHSAIQQRLQGRRLMLIQKELEILSGELQDLSRFILLQKIAVKKLFKKFIKHSDYPHKQELVDKITTECLNGNPNSFVNLYLNDAALELTLMFDVINNYRANQTQTGSGFSVNNNRKLSFATEDSFGLSSLIDGHSKDFVYSRATTFDLISHKKGSVCQRFWVHKDNLDEMKFKLLSGFKLISDDSGIMDEEHEQEGLVRQYENQRLSEQNSSVHLKHTRSELNLPEHAEDPDATFHPDTEVVSIWLNNLDDPLVTSQTGVGFLSASDNFLSGGVVAQIHNTQYPNSKRAEKPLLISPIGGLHQFAMTTLNETLIHSLFSPSKLPPEVFKNKILKQWCESGLVGNPKMAQLSLDWCIDKKMAPLAKVAVNRLRFISVTDDTPPKVECYITLDSDIRISQISSLKDVHFHIPEDSIPFPHSILEVKYDSPLKVLPSVVQSLINSHLVYRVDNLNFSLNNYLLSKFYQDSLTDEAMLEYVAPWFDDLQSKDIRKLPSIAKKTSEEVSKQSSPQGILLNKYEAQLQQQQELQQQLLEGKRYWNEFDDGSDLEDDQGYYVDDDYELSGSRTPFGNFLGLGFLTSSRIEAILNLSDKISSKLTHIINSFKHEEPSPLLPEHQDRPHFYKSVINGSSPLENDTESDTDNSDHKLFIHRYGKQAENERSYRRRQPSLVYGEARPNDLLAQVNHDRILSFLYLTAMLVSFLTTGVGLGVIFSTLKSGDDLEQTSGMILLLCFGMGCLVLSLILSGVSVCLLMTRYSNAPMWHQASVYSSLIIVTILFIISLVSCL